MRRSRRSPPHQVFAAHIYRTSGASGINGYMSAARYQNIDRAIQNDTRSDEARCDLRVVVIALPRSRESIAMPSSFIAA
jgi:hypothetical protein